MFLLFALIALLASLADLKPAKHSLGEQLLPRSGKQVELHTCILTLLGRGSL